MRKVQYRRVRRVDDPEDVFRYPLFLVWSERDKKFYPRQAKDIQQTVWSMLKQMIRRGMVFIAEEVQEGENP